MAITQLRPPLGYCTESDIENFLLIDINDSFSDQINNWISIAEDDVNKFLGYTTASGVLAEEITNEVSTSAIVNNNNDLVIYTRKRPIISVSGMGLSKGSESLTLSLTTGSENRYNIPEPRNYILYPEREISTTGGSLIIGGFRGMRSSDFLVNLSYIAGYTTVPGPINLATIMLASDYILRHENKNGLSMIQQGRVTKEFFQRKGGESDLKLDAQDLLRPYRMASKWLLG